MNSRRQVTRSVGMLMCSLGMPRRYIKQEEWDVQRGQLKVAGSRRREVRQPVVQITAPQFVDMLVSDSGCSLERGRETLLLGQGKKSVLLRVGMGL